MTALHYNKTTKIIKLVYCDYDQKVISLAPYCLRRPRLILVSFFLTIVCCNKLPISGNPLTKLSPFLNSSPMLPLLKPKFTTILDILVFANSALSR